MNPPMQPRTVYAPTGATGTAFEEEYSLAKEIFLGSTTITLGLGQQEPGGPVAQEPSGAVAQGPSGPGEPEMQSVPQQ